MVVFLGDLLDGGPDAAGGVGLAMGAGGSLGTDAVHLIEGNHEAVLRIVLDGDAPGDVARRAGEAWRGYGGHATALAVLGHGGRWEERGALRSAFGDYLARLEGHHRSGNVLFVHAGLHPWIEPAKQLSMRAEELFGRRAIDPDSHPAFVRRPFLAHRPTTAAAHHGLFVVHGHSPVGLADEADDDAAVARSRLNLDAGSWATGRARMAVMRGDGILLVEVDAMD